MNFKLICKFFLINTIISVSSKNPKMSHQKVPENQLKYFNTFSNSFIYIINFPGYNIDLPIVTQPVVLLKYYSFANKKLLIPWESYNSSKKSRNKLKSKRNKTAYRIIDQKLRPTIPYIDRIFEQSYMLSGKNLHLEFIIYLYPPNEVKSPELYHKVYWSDTRVLKDPFWLKYEPNEYKNSSFYKMSKVSLLICTSSSRQMCTNNHHKKQWVYSVLGNHINHAIRLLEIVQIMKTSSDAEQLSILCPYCNPCDPLQMVDITSNKFNLSTWLNNNKMFDKKSMPQSIRVALYWGHTIKYGNIKEKGAKTRKALLTHLGKLDIKTHTDFLPHSIDIHVTQLLFPENVTIHHSGHYENKWYASKKISVKGCSKPVNYPAKFRPFISRHTNEYLAYFSEIALVFQKDRLRFVSCHKETPHWITQLNQLVFAFDATTWALIIFTVLMLAHILVSHEQVSSVRFWNATFTFIASIMDQSCDLFQLPKKSRILHFSLPLMFMVLSNEYKGDNITNLTVEPNLVPFDTFDSLVENKFDVRLRRYNLNDYEKSMSSLKRNTKVFTELLQKNGHEDFPMVSELWYMNLMRFPYK